ncbi:MAG: tRNA (guanosine(46)-N7)-methyltransferase TrmB [Nitrospina sp.]|jgi:tRNA (guanine-N7-)-methyltransferase|nr:tRNA (guanosine(46)-N7)-methyltransferase TrmB [Nitrospina sp.]MBT3415493.1 tRNA (guanosine(46)-N7)-methyltransferase TrmB [Nitrospina sp.]MBT3855858.1 tRNA (guanosine(46)-N7)-methyltransferase TrmB [Nitrospina sp.]MBT4104645.1 tRNA (guanosine(46)-N7)-methyltransferase TrmB [Nitrospina sp.]MBT4389266.1 tRNA (guanosine(46)-N7)-methyltransferase TrmB [Nitrospina sp.]
MTPLISFAKIAEEDPNFLDTDEWPDWQTQFGNHQPLKLEIGFGMGNFLIEMAAQEPHSNFIGMDFYHKGIRKLMTRIKKLQLENIRVAYGDVRVKVPLLFKDGELETVYINFPDPWPKKRHTKRRLIKPDFVKLIGQKLAPEGRIYLATDFEVYAMEMLEHFNAEPLFQNQDPESGFLESREDLPKTKYEKNFINAGHKIYYLEFSRLGVATPTT